MKTRRWPALPVMVVALLMMMSPGAIAQVLQQVPSDALVVVKIRNLQDVSTKASGLMQAMGVANLNPAMADPLAAIQQQTGIANGLNQNGDAAIYIPASFLDDPDVDQPPAVMLWPVTDYKAFIGNFPEAQTEGEITTFKMGQNPMDSYAANWGKYAAISQSRELIAQKPADVGLKAAGLTGKQLEANDITLYFNVAPAREKLLPKLKEARPQIIAEVEAGMAEEEAQQKYLPLAKAAVNRGLDFAEQLLKETNAATYGINLNNEGINTTLMAEFDPKSQLGQRAAQVKGVNDPLLAGLPDAQYLVFGGSKFDSKVLSAVIEDLVGPIEGELTKLGEEGKAVATYIDAMKKMLAAGDSSRFGMIAPTGQLGQESLFQMINIATGDAKAMLEAQKQMFEVADEFTALTGGGQVQSKTTVTPKAKTVAGVQLDQIQSVIGAEGEGPEAQQIQQMMGMMYGPNGITAYTGIIGDKTLITVQGAGDELLEKAVTAAKANENVLSKRTGVEAVSKQLPQSRNMVMYVPLDTIITTGLTYAQQFGMPIQLQLPADLPPLGFTAGAEGSAVRFDSHIPAQLVQSLISAGMQAFMQMQGGQQPGGPGGL